MMKLLIKIMSYQTLADMASIPVKKPATTIWREIGLLVSWSFDKISWFKPRVEQGGRFLYDAIFLFYFKKWKIWKCDMLKFWWKPTRTNDKKTFHSKKVLQIKMINLTIMIRKWKVDIFVWICIQRLFCIKNIISVTRFWSFT